MNLFQLVFKQMRQRALSTWLTMLSVMLGVALAVAILIIQRHGTSLFAQSDFGYDVIVGPPKGSALQLTVNSVYHIDRSPGTFSYSLYEELKTSPQYRPLVRHAVPMAVGDMVEGLRLVGTTPAMFGYDDEGNRIADDRAFNYRVGRRAELAEGVMFHPRKFQAVIGSDVPRRIGKNIGDTFVVSHGITGENAAQHVHEETWKIVGRLAPTNTALDRVVFIPLVSFYAIPEHEDAMEAIDQLAGGVDPVNITSRAPAAKAEAHDDHAHDDHAHDDHGHDHAGHDHDGHAQAGGEGGGHDHDAHDHEGHDHGGHDHAYHLHDGEIHLDLPEDKWRISAVLVKSRGSGAQAQQLMYAINNRDQASAVNPAAVMREFFDNFLSASTRVLLLISTLVSIVAGVGILVSIYNSVSARSKEIAVLRALGATRERIVTLICLEAALIGLLGGIAGIAVGHFAGAAGSAFLQRLVGEGFPWQRVGLDEVWYVAGVVVLAVLAGLVPALKAYRTPVATNLTTA